MQFVKNKYDLVKMANSMSLSQSFFRYIHGNQLIYNICWEDPAIDRKLMQINEHSTIAMITSAGCNALCYLIDQPKRIDCVDMNYRQNALLDFKIQLINHTDHATFFSFFGKGFHPRALDIYESSIRNHLRDERFKLFWDSHITHFQKGTFFHSGSSGKMAKWIVSRLKRKNLLDQTIDLLNETDQGKKNELFNHIFPQLFPKSLKFFINSDIAMSMLGVPKAQKALIVDEEGSVYAFIEKKLRHVFTSLDNRANYFWKYYLQGGLINEEEGPEYLKSEHFELLKKYVHRIQLHTQPFADTLLNQQKNYSHFVLLDHQDWMATYEPRLLEKEWKAIFNTSSDNACYLLRSASLNRHFMPEWAHRSIKFFDETTSEIHPFDRVGTYGSTHFGAYAPKLVHV